MRKLGKARVTEKYVVDGFRQHGTQLVRQLKGAWIPACAGMTDGDYASVKRNIYETRHKILHERLS